ncbi:MAG: hypothetical protein CYPHOPRED_001309 [Cyphobasidiales sp. Tagirdzhanova-0007]|nr:MAG: hypothetical protein CYPHOPRED_001309 [Cyphobasidiales sp. Tagirdzhanova-0007]
MPAGQTPKIPEEVPDEIAPPIMCSGATVLAALKRTDTRSGQWIVIVGAGGGVGSMAIQCRRKPLPGKQNEGLEPGQKLQLTVKQVDSGDAKGKVCLQLGAEAFIDFRDCDHASDETRKITGNGAHAVLVTGNTAAAYKDACNHLRKCGTLVCVGLPTPGNGAFAGAEALHVTNNKWNIQGSVTSNMYDVNEALELAARGAVKPHVTTYPFGKWPEMVKQLADSQSG